MIVEINGLPGSGKTFLFCQLTLELVERGYETVYVSRLETKLIGKVFQKIFSTLLYISEVNHNMMIKNLVARCNHKKAIYAGTIEAKSYIKRYLYLRWLYRKLRNHKKIYLFDEGMYQVLTALTVDFKLAVNDVQNLLQYYCNDDLPNLSLLYNASIQQSLESISVRNRKICDIDNLKGVKLKEMLMKYEEVFEFLLDNNSKRMVTLKRQDPIQYNVSKTIREIEDLI